VEALHPAARIVLFGMGPDCLDRPLCRRRPSLDRPRTKLLDAGGRGLADQLLDLGAGDGLLLRPTDPLSRGHHHVREATRLWLATVLLTDDASGGLADLAGWWCGRCAGDTSNVALHGATLAALEAIALGLAVADRQRHGSLGQAQPPPRRFGARSFGSRAASDPVGPVTKRPPGRFNQ